MDATLILIIFSLLVVFSYLFDSFARKTKFPSVILLMLTGMMTRAVLEFYNFTPWGILDDLIKVLGTVGLILIVLEGALELEISKEKMGIMIRGFLAAAVLLLANIFIISQLLDVFFEITYEAAVLHAIPLSIISSAVAIPSASGFDKDTKEFVVYESTFSDIIGILIFSYAIRQFEIQAPLIGFASLTNLGLQLLGIIVISVCITFLLFQLMKSIVHPVKFFLLLALLVLVYAIGKYLHLPALVTIFIFGLILSNSTYFLPAYFLRGVKPEKLEDQLKSFHLLTAESTFLVRTFFFLFFGFSISLSNLSNPSAYWYGLLIVGAMLLARYIYMAVSTLKIKPSSLTYHAPRGLISILLFFQIKELDNPQFQSDQIDQNLLLIVIILSIAILLIGTMKKTPQTGTTQKSDTELSEVDITIPNFDETHASKEDTNTLND
ncbi:MAG: cation:proton antiporter [Bacteroidetes bacterium]|nr:cation:proton antiporter [Bacteroidota bacterium]MDA0937861.1 cation:proton antiporter [Bacteroidota bacterium]MDA1344109.1 cation:proton antiporter [Bacteroidota bacterium]